MEMTLKFNEHIAVAKGGDQAPQKVIRRGTHPAGTGNRSAQGLPERPLLVTGQGHQTAGKLGEFLPRHPPLPLGRAPMGTTVIGGLVCSTFLTLLIVPASFSLADGLEKRLGPKLRRSLLTYEPEHGEASRRLEREEGALPAE